MSLQKNQVRKFYAVLWDEQDHAAMPSVLREDFTFRGSLGQEKRGHAGFGEYVDMVHEALAEYRCHVQDLVEEGNQVFARMLFTGIHQNPFMGFEPRVRPRRRRIRDRSRQHLAFPVRGR